jgi:hypothetical protein
VKSGVFGALALAAALLASNQARADVILLQKDRWKVFMNGRMQAFLNYNDGSGYPRNVIDGNNKTVTLQSGGYDSDVVEKPKVTAANDPGHIQELRVRTGFVGNVLGFGIERELDGETKVLGYTAVTTFIESTDRRKYLGITPDWRESYLKITAPWGSVTAGRALTLFSRGATEITYLYGFKYGLGWPGSVSANGPTAGHVGFGVLGNGFGAGIAYATPSLAGAQLTVGAYDANVLPGSTFWERARWPRAEGEVTYEMKLGTAGMFKLFGNGMWQQIYEKGGDRSATMAGVGYGGRIEVGPVHLGLAGHYGTGIGLNFALDPSDSFFNPETPDRKFRTMDGYYAQLQVSPLKSFDLAVGAGMSQVKLLKEDVVDFTDDDADDPDGDGLTDADLNPTTPLTAATPASDDDGVAGPDSAGFVPVKRQLGLSGGVTVHLSDNLHLAFEYFRAVFTWYKPSPAAADAQEPRQAFYVLNAGITYDF